MFSLEAVEVLPLPFAVAATLYVLALVHLGYAAAVTVRIFRNLPVVGPGAGSYLIGALLVGGIATFFRYLAVP